MRRLFIAIEIDEIIKKEICDFLKTLSKELPNEKLEDCGKLHITILFLGNTNIEDQRLIDTIKAIKFNREIEIKGLNAFYNGRFPRVLFLNVITNLEDIHNELCNKLDIRDERFSPHITISRLKNTKEITNLIQKYSDIKFTFLSNHLSLFNSDMHSYQRIYP